MNRSRGVPLIIDGATYYTTAEAAERLGVAPGAVRDAIARGVLAYRTIAPRRNMVAEHALEDYRRDHLHRRGRPKGAKNKQEASRTADMPPAGHVAPCVRRWLRLLHRD